MSEWCGAVSEGLSGVELGRVRGFVFDVDGTLVHRGRDGRARPQPGAVGVLERIRASGRPLVLFTNASHVPSPGVARGLREDGLPIADAEMLTPTDSAISYLRGSHCAHRVFLFGSPAIAPADAELGDRADRRRGRRGGVRRPSRAH